MAFINELTIASISVAAVEMSQLVLPLLWRLVLVLLGVASVIVVVENLEAVAVIASANADVRATGGCVFGVATYCHMCCSCYLPTATGVEVVVVEDVTFCSFC